MTSQDALYTDPSLAELYDALNTSRSDFDFYLTRLPKPPAQVMDLGCGTGTFAIELANLGYRVVGCDPNQAMLEIALRKPEASNVRWQCGVLMAEEGQAAFDTIVMTGHAFQCLLEDAAIARLFEAAYANLAAGGKFLFETRNAAVRPWEAWCPEKAGPSVKLPGGRTVAVVHTVLDVTGERVLFREAYKMSGEKVRISESYLRFASKEDITTFAEEAGLRCVQIWGDWDGSLFDQQSSPEIIFELRKD